MDLNHANSRESLRGLALHRLKTTTRLLVKNGLLTIRIDVDSDPEQTAPSYLYRTLGNYRPFDTILGQHHQILVRFGPKTRNFATWKQFSAQIVIESALRAGKKTMNRGIS